MMSANLRSCLLLFFFPLIVFHILSSWDTCIIQQTLNVVKRFN
nr:MAG TPA: hypothetical protein [Caudoviricetes sp.]